MNHLLFYIFDKINVHLGFILIFLLGTFLRFYGLESNGYWLDEIITIRVSNQDLTAIINGPRPPLFFILEHFWIEIFGTTEAATRTLTALLSSAGIIIFYCIGNELFNKRIALISTYFFAVSKFLIYHAQNIRYYSFSVFFGLASYYYYAKFLKKPTYLNSFIYYFASTSLYYNHHMGVFLILAQNVHYLIFWKKYKNSVVRWISIQFLVLFSISPSLIRYILSASEGKSTSPEWISMPDIYSVVAAIVGYLGDIIKYQKEFGFPLSLDIPINLLTYAVLFYIVSIILFIIWKGFRNCLERAKLLSRDTVIAVKLNSNIYMVILWFLLPVMLPFILSFIISPMFEDRYTAVSAPPFFLLVALVLYKSRYLLHELTTVVFITVLIIPGLIKFYFEPHNTQYREAAFYLSKNLKSDDLLVTIGFAEPLLFYYTEDAGRCNVNDSMNTNTMLNKIDKCIRGKDSFWVITLRHGSKKGKEKFEEYIRFKDEYKLKIEKKMKDIDIFKYRRHYYYGNNIQILYD